MTYIVDRSHYQTELARLTQLDKSEQDTKRDWKRLLHLKRLEAGLCAHKRQPKLSTRTVNKLQNLANKYPNARDVIEELASQAYLQLMLGAPSRRLPFAILLYGPPGCGKTSIARAILEAFELPIEPVPISLYAEAFSLSGLELGYDSGAPGLIADILARQPEASVGILLDELDKGATFDHRRPSYLPLLQLMEPTTAKAFHDVALEMDLDASHLSFVATANDLSAIPAPLASRMMAFHIPAPTKAQLPTIAKSVYSELRRESFWGQHFGEHLGSDVVNELARLSPREMRGAIQRAIAKAVRRNGKGLRERLDAGEVLHLSAIDFRSREPSNAPSKPVRTVIPFTRPITSA